MKTEYRLKDGTKEGTVSGSRRVKPGLERIEKPVWQEIVDIGNQIPASELKRVPADLSKNLDHYLYGSS